MSIAKSLLIIFFFQGKLWLNMKRPLPKWLVRTFFFFLVWAVGFMDGFQIRTQARICLSPRSRWCSLLAVVVFYSVATNTVNAEYWMLKRCFRESTGWGCWGPLVTTFLSVRNLVLCFCLFKDISFNVDSLPLNSWPQCCCSCLNEDCRMKAFSS